MKDSSEQSVHFLNGKFVTEDKLLIHVRDLGFTRGYAVFDFFITYPHHKTFKLSEHVDRLLHSAELIGLKVTWRKKQIEDWVYQTLEANKSKTEKMIKIIVSGGVSDSLLPSSPTIVIIVEPRHIFPEDFYTKGIGVITVEFRRYVPYAKTNNYIEAVKQAQIAKKVGAVEPIYYDDKQVFEGSTSNVFALIDGKLKTPKSNVLGGITKAVLLEILHLDVPLMHENFTISELLKAQEVFLTSSNREITPVTKVDGQQVGDGAVGKITKEVMKQFKKYTQSD